MTTAQLTRCGLPEELVAGCRQQADELRGELDQLERRRAAVIRRLAALERALSPIGERHLSAAGGVATMPRRLGG